MIDESKVLHYFRFKMPCFTRLVLLLLLATRVTDCFHHGFRQQVGSHTAPNNRVISTQRESSAQEQAENVEKSLSILACGPPEILKELKVGDSLRLPSTPVEITRIAFEPGIFTLRKFLPFSEEREALMDEAVDCGMENAETKSGQVLHRTKSSVAWIYDEGESVGQDVASFMTGFVSRLFLHEDLLSCERYEPEGVQVVRYTTGGKFDVHHDADNRVVTVLSYLNGIAGTWFPFARVAPPEATEGDEGPPAMALEGVGMTEGKNPGQDGIWIVGNEYKASDENNQHIVRVEAGDAVVFYNYEFNEESGAPIMAWRSLHAGMPTNHEKWIATNWIGSDLLCKRRRHCHSKEERNADPVK